MLALYKLGIIFRVLLGSFLIIFVGIAFGFSSIKVKKIT
jgi:hypothetical protein